MHNETDLLELDDTEFEEFYENFGSRNFQLQSRVLEELGTKQIDIYFKSIGFVTTTLSVIGLIAGFGFTAIGYVENLFCSLLGRRSCSGLFSEGFSGSKRSIMLSLAL